MKIRIQEILIKSFKAGILTLGEAFAILSAIDFIDIDDLEFVRQYGEYSKREIIRLRNEQNE